MTKERIATYLKIIGIVQLIGLNIGGIFWLVWASGIRAANQSSRAWVITIHSIYVALASGCIARWFTHPSSLNHLEFFNHRIDTPRGVVLGFGFLLILIFGLPVVWLMDKRIRNEFTQQIPHDQLLACSESSTE